MTAVADVQGANLDFQSTAKGINHPDPTSAQDIATKNYVDVPVRLAVTQASHGFALSNVVQMSGSTWVKAQADSAAHALETGIVIAVIDTNNFIVQYAGYNSTAFSSLTAGSVYYLSASSAGALTTTEPTGATQISLPIMVAITTTSVLIFNQRGLPSTVKTTDYSAKGIILVGTGSNTYSGQSVGADDTSLVASSAAGGGVAWVNQYTATKTLTNKRVTKRVLQSSGPGGTPSINTDNYDEVELSALAANISSMTSGMTGTPGLHDSLVIWFKDNGTLRTIAWGALFESCGATLPTTTVANKRLGVALKWNLFASSLWGCVGVVNEA